jgi:peptide/nickel transport system permease protein
MSSYLAKRLAGLVPLLIGITIVSFFVIHLAPGGPVDTQGAMNPKLSAQARDKMEKLYGLDQPLWVQYGQWLSKIVRFDFGRSFVDGEKVSAKITRAVPVTLLINFLSLALILLVGIPIGVASALKKGSLFDQSCTFLSLAGYSVPTFWLSLLLMSLFGVRLQWLPVAGLSSLFHEQMGFWQKTVDMGRHLVLPLSVALVTGLAGVSRFVRAGMGDVLKQNYIRMARAKGLSEARVLYGHALKNALLPVVTILGLSVPGLLGGSVIFESVFSIPGMGRLFFNSVFSRDYPVIMGILVLGAVLTLLGNLLADAAYGILDPRARVSKERG